MKNLFNAESLLIIQKFSYSLFIIFTAEESEAVNTRIRMTYRQIIMPNYCISLSKMFAIIKVVFN